VGSGKGKNEGAMKGMQRYMKGHEEKEERRRRRNAGKKEGRDG